MAAAIFQILGNDKAFVCAFLMFDRVMGAMKHLRDVDGLSNPEIVEAIGPLPALLNVAIINAAPDGLSDKDAVKSFFLMMQMVSSEDRDHLLARAEQMELVLPTYTEFVATAEDEEATKH